MTKYNVYGVNSMGSVWFLSDKDGKECSLYDKAPKELRAVFDSVDDAKRKAEELDYNFRFGTTKHFIRKAEN